MNFRLDEDQQQLQDALLKILAHDKVHSRLRAVIDGKAAWDEETWRELVDFGLASFVVPEAYEGAGLTMIELAVAAEALGRSGVAVPFLGHALATVAIASGGDDAQKARWLPKLATGEVLASVAISDNNDSWAPAAWTLAPSGGTISGAKLNVPFGEIADILVVGLKGGQLGIVETAAAGVSRESMKGIDMTRPLAAVTFDGAAVELLADGPAGATLMWDAALTLLSADAFGGASRLLEMTRDYALTREAFGAKLGDFQGYKHQLANLALEIEPTRGLYWYAAYAFAKIPEKATEAASLAKGHAAEVFIQAGRLLTELHGGIGFTWEYDSHIWLKRAMFDYSWGGRPESLFLRAADAQGWAA